MTEERIFMEYSYEMFLVEESINRASIFNYLDAHVALESGDLRAVSYVCESAVDSIRNGIHKIIDTVKRLWNKLLERVGEFITSDKAYLDKYKDTINKHPFKDHELDEYFEYDTEGITSKFAIPSIDAGFDTMIESEDENGIKEAFMKKYLPSLNSSNEIKDEVVEALRGEAKTIKMDSLNKASLFNYCANYDKVTLANLKNEVAKLDSIKNAANDKISKALQGIEAIQKSKEDLANNKDISDNDKAETMKKNNDSLNSLKADIGKEAQQQQQTAQKESFTFVNELKVSGATDGKSSGSSTTSPNLNSEDRAKIASGAGKYMPNSASDDNALSASQEKYKRIQKNAPTFFTCCGNILAGKMTVALAAYKQSMQILRVHVRDYVADEAAPNANKK